MRRKKRFALSSLGAATVASLTLLLVAARDARADEPDAPPPSCSINCTAFEAPRRPRPVFGDAGTLILDDLLGIGVGPANGVNTLGQASAAPVMTGWLRYEDVKIDEAGPSLHITTLAFAPALDLFVTRKVSIGAQLSLFHSSLRAGSEGSSSLLGGGLRPRVGWVVPLTEGLYFWPRLFGTLAVTYAKNDAVGVALAGASSVGGAPTQTALAWGLGVDAMLVAPLGAAVAVTFGPTVGYGRSDVVDGAPAPVSTSVALGVHGGIALTL